MLLLQWLRWRSYATRVEQCRHSTLPFLRCQWCCVPDATDNNLAWLKQLARSWLWPMPFKPIVCKKKEQK